MNFPQLKAKVCCIAQNLIALAAEVTALTARVAALEAGGGGGEPSPTPIPSSDVFITDPPVSSLSDPRGEAGDWSFNPDVDGGTMYQKVSDDPDEWIAWSVAVA